MTTTDERYQAILNARDFLYRLMDPKQTPKVPKKIRQEARARLKHFPTDFDVEQTFKRNEDVVRCVKRIQNILENQYYD